MKRTDVNTKHSIPDRTPGDSANIAEDTSLCFPLFSDFSRETSVYHDLREIPPKIIRASYFSFSHLHDDEITELFPNRPNSVQIYKNCTTRMRNIREITKIILTTGMVSVLTVVEPHTGLLQLWNRIKTKGRNSYRDIILRNRGYMNGH